MTARITVVRDAENQQPVTKVTTSPEKNELGMELGGKTVRHYPMQKTSKTGQVSYTWVPLEPRDTVISKMTFDVEMDSGETHHGLTKRQINNLLGARQTRKAFKAMTREDKDAYRAYRKAQRAARA